ncbi:MAG: DUF1731 domain-containing protein [Planctomycetota bacterium]|nr:MAG: DUF1731 domain-containing protein [Planctomycetota bacterium]
MTVASVRREGMGSTEPVGRVDPVHIRASPRRRNRRAEQDCLEGRSERPATGQGQPRGTTPADHVGAESHVRASSTRDGCRRPVLGVSPAHRLADRGWSVTIPSRNEPRRPGPKNFVPWDAGSLGDWSSCLDGPTGLVNLVGRSVTSTRLAAEGFRFEYPSLPAAIRACFAPAA